MNKFKELVRKDMQKMKVYENGKYSDLLANCQMFDMYYEKTLSKILDEKESQLVEKYNELGTFTAMGQYYGKTASWMRLSLNKVIANVRRYMQYCYEYEYLGYEPNVFLLNTTTTARKALSRFRLTTIADIYKTRLVDIVLEYGSDSPVTKEIVEKYNDFCREHNVYDEGNFTVHYKYSKVLQRKILENFEDGHLIEVKNSEEYEDLRDFLSKAKYKWRTGVDLDKLDIFKFISENEIFYVGKKLNDDFYDTCWPKALVFYTRDLKDYEGRSVVKLSELIEELQN